MAQPEVTPDLDDDNNDATPPQETPKKSTEDVLLKKAIELVSAKN